MNPYRVSPAKEIKNDKRHNVVYYVMTCGDKYVVHNFNTEGLLPCKIFVWPWKGELHEPI
jgi:hypothetical protein